MSDDTTLVVDRSALTVQPDAVQLTPIERGLVAQVMKNFDPLGDQTAITQYGIVQATGIADLADPVMKLVRAKDQPQAATILDNCAKDARSLDFNRIKEAEKGIQLPNGFKRFTDAINRLRKQVETLDKKMVDAAGKLKKDKALMTSRANTLSGLLQQSLDIYSQMRVYVFAGEAKLAQLRTTMSQAVEKAKTAADKMMAQQEVTRLQGIITRLEARLLALKQMQTIAVQQIFSIQTVLNNQVGLLDTVEMNLAAVQTVWKTQVVVAISAYEQHQIALRQSNFAANLGALMNQTADQIGMAIEATANAQATGIVTMDSLESAGQKMVTNIEQYFAAQKRVEEAAAEGSKRIDAVRAGLIDAVKKATGEDKGLG